MITITEKLALADQIDTVVSFLERARMNDFISIQEAKSIFTDILKEAGFKKPVVKIESAPAKKIVEESK